MQRMRIRAEAQFLGLMVVLTGAALTVQPADGREETEHCVSTGGAYCSGDECCFTGENSCTTDPETCERVCSDDPDAMGCQN